MKKILVMTAIAAAIAMPASAQSFKPQGYVGAGLGSSKNDNSNGVVAFPLVAPPTATNFSLDTSKTSWKILGGYQMTPNWGIEAQYSDLGKRDITLIEIGGAGRIGGSSIDAEQYSIAVTGKYMFHPGYFVHGKLGASSNKLSNSNTCLTGSVVECVTRGSESNTGLMFGFGLGHDFTKNWSIKGGYENFGKVINRDINGDSVKMSNMGVNVIYSF